MVNSSNGEIKNSKGQLKVRSLNVCGLVSKSKIPDFVEFVSSYDILCFTETEFDIYNTCALSKHIGNMCMRLRNGGKGEA
jgi:hypothetical protein